MRTTGGGQSALLLFDVVEVLDQEKIDYAVIGAMAASVHGVVRASVDADLVISVAPKDFASLARKFKATGFSASLREGDFEDPIPALLELMDAFDNRVDLLAGIRGLEPTAFSRVIEVTFQGAVLKVLGREDFIATKIFAGGPQHLIDAQNTIAVADGKLDMVLLRRVTQRFGPDALRALESILNARWGFRGGSMYQNGDHTDRYRHHKRSPDQLAAPLTRCTCIERSDRSPDRTA